MSGVRISMHAAALAKNLSTDTAVDLTSVVSMLNSRTWTGSATSRSYLEFGFKSLGAVANVFVPEQNRDVESESRFERSGARRQA
jgi:hypothetical protein